MKRLTICLLLFPCLAVSLSAQDKPRKEKKDMKDMLKEAFQDLKDKKQEDKKQ